MNASKELIKNPQKLEAFYRELDAKDNLSSQEAMAIFMLHSEAVALGAIHSDNILEGIETSIRIADAVNRVGCQNSKCTQWQAKK